MRLLIGNKNYSSWSMRPWVLLRELGIAFEEERISFNDPEFKARVSRHSPAGKVPVLVDGAVVVWDSLAIVEYLADKFPSHGVWPKDPVARARARSNCAEMHSGFVELRRTLPMNCEARFDSRPLLQRAVSRDLERIFQLWRDARASFGQDGPYLFGRFSAADAYFAPVAMRFLSYGIELPDDAASYVRTLEATGGVKAWVDDARAEHDWVEEDEIYRRPGLPGCG